MWGGSYYDTPVSDYNSYLSADDDPVYHPNDMESSDSESGDSEGPTGIRQFVWEWYSRLGRWEPTSPGTGSNDLDEHGLAQSVVDAYKSGDCIKLLLALGRLQPLFGPSLPCGLITDAEQSGAIHTLHVERIQHIILRMHGVPRPDQYMRRRSSSGLDGDQFKGPRESGEDTRLLA